MHSNGIGEFSIILAASIKLTRGPVFLCLFRFPTFLRDTNISSESLLRIPSV